MPAFLLQHRLSNLIYSDSTLSDVSIDNNVHKDELPLSEITSSRIISASSTQEPGTRMEMMLTPATHNSSENVSTEATYNLHSTYPMKEMSKKEKQFHLSKDTGIYSQLNPITWHEAQREYGKSLRLYPSDPKGQGGSLLRFAVEMPNGRVCSNPSLAFLQYLGMLLVGN